ILRRRSALSIRMNASISLKPFESETKSSIWAIDNAPLEPCGAAAFGAPSKKKATGTCRTWEICCNAIDAGLVFLDLLVGDAERIGQLLLAHCQHLAAHAHPRADVLVHGVRDLFRSDCIAKRHS